MECEISASGSRYHVYFTGRDVVQYDTNVPVSEEYSLGGRADVSRHHEGSKFLTSKDTGSRPIRNISSHVPNYKSRFRTPHS